MYLPGCHRGHLDDSLEDTCLDMSMISPFSTQGSFKIECGGLSTGAIIGIVIGVLFLIALIVGVCYYMQKQQKKQNQANAGNPGVQASTATQGAGAGATGSV